MKTFELFIEATKSDITKDAILKQTTEAIFSVQPTGFDHKDNPNVPTKQITEILSNTSKGS